MKNPFEKALHAKKAKQARKTGAAGRSEAAASGRADDRAEKIKNGKFLSSTRADKK